ncbi:PAS domain-containing protein [Pelagibius sp.]|uniref:PAS domain-containing protein n=1 Tax=Pelagibius sp. TaxID=1931238 RepID=UPI003B504FEC
MLIFPSWRKSAEKAKSYLASAEAITLLEAWISLGTSERPPRREDLRPERFPALLPDLWLMDFDAETGQLRYRLEGEHIRARYDRSLIGRSLEDTVAAEALPRVRGYFQACVEAPAISMVIGRLYHEWQQPGYGERLLLPLMHGDGHAEGIIGITVYRETFADRTLAEQRAKRITCIVPLDGSEPTEEAS